MQSTKRSRQPRARTKPRRSLRPSPKSWHSIQVTMRAHSRSYQQSRKSKLLSLAWPNSTTPTHSLTPRNEWSWPRSVMRLTKLLGLNARSKPTTVSKAKPPISNEVKLWHNAEGLGYASVQVNGHWENYRLGTTMFEGWLRTAYGKQNTCTINGQEFPQAPGTAAVKDAVAQLKGIAQQRGLQSEPVIRVGGSMDEIWIDLGNSDWSAVRVTAEGWSIEDQPNVPFVRTGAMRPLPEPAKGGKIQELKRVLNVRSSDFVLCVAFELQALNPEGPYPTLNAFGEPGDGKSYICNALQRIVDPNS